MTPHLLAEASRMMMTPRFCSWTRASGVMKELAPSTMAVAEGVPSGRKKRSQLSWSMVSGRPPAGMKRSAGTVKVSSSNSRENSSMEIHSSVEPGLGAGHLPEQLAQSFAAAAGSEQHEAARGGAPAG